MQLIFLIMNKIIILLVLCFLVFLMPTQSFSNGNSSSMGFLSVVVSDGPFDVLRNPALLGLQNSKYSAGVSVKGGYSVNEELSVNNSTMQFNSFQDTVYQANAVFTFKEENNVYGFAFATMSDEELYKKSIIEMSMHGYLEEAHANIEAKFRHEENNFAPAFVAATAFPLSKSIILGIHSSIARKTVDVAQNSDGKILFYVPQEITTEFNLHTIAYSFEASMGLLKILEKGHIGFLLRSGKGYSSTTTADLFANYAQSTSKSTSNPLRYISGMSLAAGFYLQPLNFLGISLETEYRFPVEYRDNTLAEKEGKIEELAFLQRIGNRFQFKTGVEWCYGSDFRLSTGIFISHEKKEKAQLHNEQMGFTRDSEKLKFTGITLGGSYNLHNAYSFTITGGFVKINIDQYKGENEYLTLLYDMIFILVSASANF